MEEINKAYNAYYEYTNDFIKYAYITTEQLNKEIEELNKDKKELINEKDELKSEIYNLNKKIQDTNKINILLVKKEIESTTLILKLDKTIAELRDELRKLKKN